MITDLQHNATLQKQLLSLIKKSSFLNDAEYNDFCTLITSKEIIKKNNPSFHCCVFFIPFNGKTNEIFIVHHKKANQWIVPGGHIEEGELLEDAVKREAQEELGVHIANIQTPFLFSVMSVKNKGYSCKKHYDSWFLISISEIKVAMDEFNQTQWISINDVQKYITHPTYLEALKRIPYQL